MVMGGPVAGAIAGFAAAGATLAMPYIEGFFNATEQAKRFSEQLDVAIKKSRDLFESRSKEMEAAVDFRAERRGLDESKDAESAVSKRQQELDRIAARQKEIEAARERNRLDDSIPIESRGTIEEQRQWQERLDKSNQLDKELMLERLELMRKERDLRIEMGQLRADGVKLQQQELELQKQKDQEDFAGRIRKFQEEDAKDAERELKENENALAKAERDAERLAGMRSSGRGGLAQVATANSQSLLRAQEMIKQAAKASQERQKQLEEARKQVAELKAIRRALEGDDSDDVNLN
jgi:DNA repair exonuclease SbcCD ATPase subunit